MADIHDSDITIIKYYCTFTRHLRMQIILQDELQFNITIFQSVNHLALHTGSYFTKEELIAPYSFLPSPSQTCCVILPTSLRRRLVAQPSSDGLLTEVFHSREIISRKSIHSPLFHLISPSLR